MKRYCKVFYCDHRGDRYCCADCHERADCASPCLNWPTRCRLEDKERRAYVEAAAAAALAARQQARQGIGPHKDARTAELAPAYEETRETMARPSSVGCADS